MVVSVKQGSSPLILAFPHSGTFLPDDIAAKLNENGRILSDTDWHLPELYDDLAPGASIVRAEFHRYAIDANRDPSGKSLYPGQNTTTLVPLTDFDNQPIWQVEPDEAEIAARLAAFHAPYHAALEAEILRVRDAFGVAVLYDCHSIRSHIPFLFEGKLPDLNIGTNHGQTCDLALQAAVMNVAEASPFSSILNGRFVGGWTTRHYGRPDENIHAIQMELAQSTHLKTETPPFAYGAPTAPALRETLRGILHGIETTALKLAK